MEAKERIELHCYTKNSKKQSAAFKHEFYKKALALGMPAVGFCGKGTVRDICYDLGPTDDVAKPIYSVELKMVDEFKYSVMIMLKNIQGKKKLYEILNRHTLNEDYDTNFLNRVIYKNEVQELGENILIGDVAQDGLVALMLKAGAEDEAIINSVKTFDFVEVSPSQSRDEVERIINICEKAGVKVIATNKPAYLGEKQHFVYKEMRMFFGEDVSEEPDLMFLSTEEMLREFDYLDKEKAFEIVVENTNSIADLVGTVVVDRKNIESLHPQIKRAHIRLIDHCDKRLKEIYGDNIPKEVDKRVKEELKAIDMTESSFMLILLMELLEKSGYKLNSSSFRGTAGNSYILYLCGIIDYDPMKYGLSHDVLFGPGAIKRQLFIDINVSEEMAEKIYKEAATLEGISAVYKASTSMYMNKDGITEEFIEHFVSKYFGKLSDEEINEYIEIIRSFDFEDYMVHESRLLFVPDGHDISEVTPIVRRGKQIVTEHEFFYIDEALFSLNFIPMQTTALLDKLFEMTGVDADDIKDDDPEICSLLTSPKALGIDEAIAKELNHGCAGMFECDSVLVRPNIDWLKIDNFDDMVKLSCLSHGTGVWENNTEELIKHGFIKISDAISTRDDVYDYCMGIGIDKYYAYEITQFVRMGKASEGRPKKFAEKWKEYKQRLIEHNAEAWFIECCEKILYLFPKAHGISYMRMMWKLAYFKLHYPIQFYSVYFMTCKDQHFKLKLVQGGNEFEEYYYHVLNSLDKRSEYYYDYDYRDYRTVLVAKEMFLRGYTYKDLIDIK